MTLPAYNPPDTPRTCLAVALAPLLVLLAFTAVVTRLADPDTGLAVLVACGLWVVHEMHDYQRTIDGYNAHYVDHHLARHAPASLAALAQDPGMPPATRAFVQRYLDAGSRLPPDGPSY